MASDDENLPLGEPFVVWLEGASDEQRDAHYRAQRWSHVLAWQVGRLRSARQRALASHEEVLAAGHYPDEARWPFMQMDAEAHFALVAARQLLRALRAFDGNDRLPGELSNRQLRDVRDALEHWDAPGGSDAARRLAQEGADPSAHVWFPDGSGVLGDVLPDSALEDWAVAVYADLQRWDAYDGWR